LDKVLLGIYATLDRVKLLRKTTDLYGFQVPWLFVAIQTSNSTPYKNGN